jgi:hypothetical protein
MYNREAPADVLPPEGGDVLKLDEATARPRGEKSAPPLSSEAPVCWNARDIDIAGVRRWFIRRIAQAALEELRREDQHDADDE